MQQRFKWCILLALLCSSLLLWPRLQQALLAAPEERAAPQQLLQGLSEPLAEEEAWVIWESDTPIQRITAQSQQIWAGTSHKGLVGWGRDSGPTQIYTSTHGLNGLDILASAFDQAGNLWVASHDGGISKAMSKILLQKARMSYIPGIWQSMAIRFGLPQLAKASGATTKKIGRRSVATSCTCPPKISMQLPLKPMAHLGLAPWAMGSPAIAMKSGITICRLFRWPIL
jgi:hypothetical protein